MRFPPLLRLAPPVPARLRCIRAPALKPTLKRAGEAGKALRAGGGADFIFQRLSAS